MAEKRESKPEYFQHSTNNPLRILKLTKTLHIGLIMRHKMSQQNHQRKLHLLLSIDL